jgi:Xaa-Pro aminopeptidase
VNTAMYADTETSTDLFAAIPANIVDPFLYLELDGRRVAVISSLDKGTVQAADPAVEVIDPEEFGKKELMQSGMTRFDVGLEIALRAFQSLGVRDVAVPWHFPLALADRLRGADIAVNVDAAGFALRRRVKSDAQVAGIRRAQKAAEAAMALAAEMIHAAAPDLTAEAVRTAMQERCRELGCVLPDDVIVGPNEQGAAGHDIGEGPIRPGDGVIVDIWPQDTTSRCWADMTRTFVAGGSDADGELREYWTLTREALEATTAAVRPGINGRELNDIASAVYEAAGKPTARSAPGGVIDGFFHGLGHGVGLDIHEAPGLGISGDDLVAGDVITLEPGCYRQGYGGVRLEDLVLVTENGGEVLTDFPYEL